MPPGVQQIEVTFDAGIDARGTLNLSASDMTTCKSNCITISNDKSHMSKENFEPLQVARVHPP